MKVIEYMGIFHTVGPTDVSREAQFKLGNLVGARVSPLAKHLSFAQVTTSAS